MIDIKKEEMLVESKLETKPRKYEYVYKNIVIFGYLHIAALYGIYMLLFSKWETIIFAGVLSWLTVIGITAGTHRLWSHKSYKAKISLQYFLMLCQCLASQDTIKHWVRNHRLHHKYSDTDADPHNSTRGLFFSHIGWLFVKKHPEVIKKGLTIDLADINENPVVKFQERHADWLIPTIAFVIPTIIPLFWDENIIVSYHINILRILLPLNATFLVNSVAHKYGNKPYDRAIAPAQHLLVCLVTLGEGYHNFHHTFPYDYRTGEAGNNIWNFAANFIDLCKFLGLAYDLKSAGEDVVRKRMDRTGDGSDLWGRQRILPAQSLQGK